MAETERGVASANEAVGALTPEGQQEVVSAAVDNMGADAQQQLVSDTVLRLDTGAQEAVIAQTLSALPSEAQPAAATAAVAALAPSAQKEVLSDAMHNLDRKARQELLDTFAPQNSADRKAVYLAGFAAATIIAVTFALVACFAKNEGVRTASIAAAASVPSLLLGGLMGALTGK